MTKYKFSMRKKYKLRIYYTNGSEKGNLDREEFFENLNALKKRYNELFKRELYGLNPTAWKRVGENEWERIQGY